MSSAASRGWRGLPGSGGGSPLGGEQLPFRGEGEARECERELVAGESVVAEQGEQAAAGGDEQRRCGRERCRQQRGEQQEAAVGGDGGRRRAARAACR